MTGLRFLRPAVRASDYLVKEYGIEWRWRGVHYRSICDIEEAVLEKRYAEEGFMWMLENRDIVEADSHIYIGF